MKIVGKILFYPLFLINAALALLLMASGWSSFLFVKSFPVLSLMGMAFPAILAANLAFLVLWLVFYRKALWLPLAALAVTIVPILEYTPLNFGKALANVNESDIKLLSYNTFGFNMGVNKNGEATNPVLSYINRSGADIICLQESNSAVLTRVMKNTKDFLPQMSYECDTENMAILSKWPILEWKEIIFKESKNRSLYCRILIGTDTMAVYNCHLQSFGLDQTEIDDYHKLIENPKNQESYDGSKSALRKLMNAGVTRAAQADTLAGMLSRENSRYVILCGDFNDTPLSYSHRVFSRRLTDVYGKSGFGPGISYNQNRLNFRIDHVFCNRNIKPVKCRVDSSIRESDHYPVISYLRLQ